MILLAWPDRKTSGENCKDANLCTSFNVQPRVLRPELTPFALHSKVLIGTFLGWIKKKPRSRWPPPRRTVLKGLGISDIVRCARSIEWVDTYASTSPGQSTLSSPRDVGMQTVLYVSLQWSRYAQVVWGLLNDCIHSKRRCSRIMCTGKWRMQRHLSQGWVGPAAIYSIPRFSVNGEKLAVPPQWRAQYLGTDADDSENSGHCQLLPLCVSHC